MMLRPGFELANAEDMKIPQCVDTADEAIAIIRNTMHSGNCSASTRHQSDRRWGG